MKRLWWLLAICLAIPVAGGASWVAFEMSPARDAGTVRIHIAPGQSLSQTSQQLETEGVVRNAAVFRWVFQVLAGARSVPSGTFLVPTGRSNPDLVHYFQAARPEEARVTIPEGWTAGKIARLLESESVVKAGDFLDVVTHPAQIGVLGTGLATLEGRLFPDTYQLPVDSDAVSIARIFVEAFNRRTEALTANLTAQQVSDRLILASIVEREYRVASEAPIIASVFENRLSARIALGSCATIEYVLTEIEGRPHPHRILWADTEIDSPYNTYLHRGLPPGPISNPGMTALEAAFHPAKTSYLYFVVANADQGTHRFSSSFADHERARAAYLSSFVSKG